jgi:hypothetical protein
MRESAPELSALPPRLPLPTLLQFALYLGCVLFVGAVDRWRRRVDWRAGGGHSQHGPYPTRDDTARGESAAGHGTRSSRDLSNGCGGDHIRRCHEFPVSNLGQPHAYPACHALSWRQVIGLPIAYRARPCLGPIFCGIGRPWPFRRGTGHYGGHHNISALMLLLILTVALLDITCEQIRRRLIGEQALT